MFEDHYEFDEKFNNKFISELKGKNIRQKMLIIHLALEYWINRILKIRVKDEKIFEFLINNLNFYKKFELLKKLDLLNPDNIYDKEISKNIIKKIKIKMKNEGKSILKEIITNTTDRKREGEFIFFLICSSEGIINNIAVLNKLRNKYAHYFFVDKKEIDKLANNLQPVFNSDIWILDHKEKIEIIGANTVFLLKYLYLHHSNHLTFIYDKIKGLQLHFKGTGKFNWIYHFKIPSTWKKIKQLKIEATNNNKTNIKIEIEKLN